MDQLVQIRLNMSTSRPYSFYGNPHIPIPQRPKELTDFVDALSRMWGRVGVHKICKLCFEGKLDRTKEAHGCCHQCPNLGHSRCVAKPVGCATFYCGKGLVRVGEVHPVIGPVHPALEYTFSRFVSALLGIAYHSGVGNSGCYSTGVQAESKRKWTPEGLRTLRILRYAVDAWEA